MLIAKVVCSDPDCYEELDLAVEELDELDRLVCDCGHGFVLVSVSGGRLVRRRRRLRSELERRTGEVLELPSRGERAGTRRRAA